MLKPLFPQEEKEKSGVKVLENRTLKELVPKLHSVGYEVLEEKVSDSFKMKGLKIFSKKHPERSMFVLPWIRGMTYSFKDTEKTLADYPRLNIPNAFLHLPEEVKIQKMFDFVKKNDYFFLIMLPKAEGKDLFWLERYDSIPVKYWKLTYRRKDKTLDRVYFTKRDYNFVYLPVLKSQISKILKDED